MVGHGLYPYPPDKRLGMSSPPKKVSHDLAKVTPFKGWKITMPISQVSVGIGKPELPK